MCTSRVATAIIPTTLRLTPTSTETGFPDSRCLWKGPPFSNQLKIQRHFSRAYACFVKYSLMTQKLQHIRQLAYMPSLGPGGVTLDDWYLLFNCRICARICMLWMICIRTYLYVLMPRRKLWATMLSLSVWAEGSSWGSGACDLYGPSELLTILEYGCVWI